MASAPPGRPPACDAADIVPTSQLPHVWQPLDIGPTRVKHRVMYTAQTILYADDHILSDRHIAFYRERAMGGAALLITEQQAAHRLSKGSFYQGCTAWEKRVIPQYAKLADAVHEFGAKQFAQLFALRRPRQGHAADRRLAPALGRVARPVDRAPRGADGDGEGAHPRHRARATASRR